MAMKHGYSKNSAVHATATATATQGVPISKHYFRFVPCTAYQPYLATVTVKKLERGGMYMDISVQEAATFEGKMGKKTKKNKKKEASASKEVSDYNGAMLNGVEDGFELSKEDKRRKKDKKKAEVSIDVEIDGTHNEDINMKDYAKVDDNYQKEKEKRKKKKRKSKPGEDNDKSNNEIHMGGEERRCLKIDDDKDLGNDSESKARKEKKRRKEDRKKDKKESVSSPMKVCKDKETEKDEVVKDQKSSRKDNIADMKNGEEQIEKKKTHKGREGKEIIDFKGKKKSTAAEDVGKVREYYDVVVSDKVKTKKRKRETKKGKDDLGAGMQEMMAEALGNKSSLTEDKDFGYNNRNHHSARNKMREIETKNGDKGNRKKPNSVEPGSEDPKPKAKSKKVRFSSNIEVFPSSDGPSKGKEKNEDEKLVRGKRFSPEEDEIIKDAVFNYIRYNDLGEDGLAMVLRCSSHPKIRNCWKDIGPVLPHRPLQSVYYRAHILFERAESRSWTTEELERVRKYHEQHGPKWREIKLPNTNKGHWSQEEYQNLFDLVNMDLRMKAYEEKKSQHGMLRDNISWGAISDKLLTRNDRVCCEKWYRQLSSSMVAEGNWTDTDDYRLLDTLFSLDACCIEDVDWDYLLDHRSGDLCRKRWNQMINHIGEHKNKSFAEQVEILTNRYCPDLLEAREAWDKKPFRMLNQEAGVEIDPLGDLNTESERKLGQLVLENMGLSSIYSHRYPLAVRPFYTMPCSDDPAYSNSFDVFIRGEEIISGAQRVHVPEFLATRAEACGIDVKTISTYIDSFGYGAPLHGGFGVGLERVVMLFCALNNIRKTSLFPRDPLRIAP
ncbi:unnamed protein product [Camellia sinensis]